MTTTAAVSASANLDEALRPWVEAQHTFTAQVGDDAPGTIQSLRSAALEQFIRQGFPTTKNEDWHFTSVAPLLEHDFVLLASRTGDVRKEHIAPFTFGATWPTLVFVNGRYAPELSGTDGLPEEVKLLDLPTAWSESPELVDRIGQIAQAGEHAFTALNGSFLYDGAVVHVPANVEVNQPIHLLFVTDATAAKGMVHPRNLVVLGHHAKATVIESYVSLSDATSFTNAVTEASIADGATLTHLKIQREGMRAYHVGTFHADQARDSHLVSFSFATGAELSRTNIYTTLNGEGSGATMNGLYMLGGEQHCDHQTFIDHAEPNCYSRELYKGILDERSHGVFNGKVYVHPIAQKTDGKQTNNALLLSPTAQVDTKPQLEIFADDVKCTHGATVGRLDEMALFYMKSRGIDAKTARELLVYAFAADVLETIEQVEVRDALEAMTLRRYTTVEE